MRLAVCVVEPARLAEIVILPGGGAVARVVIVNVPVVEPATTVIVAGTVPTDVSLLERLTTIPPAGAGPVSVTVPIDVAGGTV